MEKAKDYGAIIESGAERNQVFQQENGVAEINLTGHWLLEENDADGDYQVFAQIKNEETNYPITETLKAEMLPDRKWKVSFKNVPVGGPYKIETCLQKKGANLPLMWTQRGDTRYDIYVGDVYIIMGQSNAAGYTKDMAYDPKQPGVQMFRECGEWAVASHPLHDSTDTLFGIYRDGVNLGHSPFISFGKKLLRKTGVPTGLIVVARGGAPMDLFFHDREHMYYEALKQITELAGVKKPRGFIWHQGCTDANEDRGWYREGLTKLINATRETFGDPELPWFIFQIFRFFGWDSTHDRSWGAVKEAQLDVSHDLKNVYIISTLDCMPSDHVHNNTYSQIMLGERLAGYVLRYLHGDQKEYLCPEIISIKRSEDKRSIELKFNNVQEGLMKVHNLEEPFTVTEGDAYEQKEIELEGWDACGDTITLRCKKEIPDGARVSAYWRTHPTFKPVFDAGTRLPILAFYNRECE